MTFRSLVVALILFVTLPLSANEKKQKDSITTLQATTLLMRDYRTFGELFSMLKSAQLMTDQDAAQITSFLETKKVQMSDKISEAKISPDKITWGKVALSYDQNEKIYRTSSGIALRSKKGESAAEAFIRVYNAIDNSCKDCVSRNSLFISSAHAEEVLDLVSAVDSKAAAALGTSLGWLFDNAVVPSGTCLVATIHNASATIALTLKAVLHKYRKFLYDGTVTCQGDQYRVHNVDFKVIDPRDTVAKALSDKELDNTFRANPVNRVCMGLTESALANTANLFIPRISECPIEKAPFDCDPAVGEDALKKALGIKHSDSIPPCNGSRAKQVQASLKQQAAEQEQQILKAVASRESASGAGSGASVPAKGAK
jgi:hypothetical protein